MDGCVVQNFIKKKYIVPLKFSLGITLQYHVTLMLSRNFMEKKNAENEILTPQHRFIMLFSS